jgi:uncharacterized protein (DUF58 family)
MTVDVLTYEGITSLERGLGFPDTDKQLAKFMGGDDVSSRIGDGYEIDGLRDYEPGDDARHIDWIKTASRSDGGLWLRQHYEDEAPLTVLVSDIPSDRYRRTIGNTMSSRALGFVSAHTLLRIANNGGSPLIGFWSHGAEPKVADLPSPRVYEGPKAPRKIIEHGLAFANASTQSAQNDTSITAKRSMFKRSHDLGMPVARERLSEVIGRARSRSQRLAKTARFIVVSDFRVDLDDTFEALKSLGNNDILAIEVTHPGLRQLDPSQDVYSTTNKNVLIESDRQREEYARLAAEKQLRIDNAMAKMGVVHIRVDTSAVDIAKELKRITKP